MNKHFTNLLTVDGNIWCRVSKYNGEQFETYYPYFNSLKGMDSKQIYESPIFFSNNKLHFYYKLQNKEIENLFPINISMQYVQDSIEKEKTLTVNSLKQFTKKNGQYYIQFDTTDVQQGNMNLYNDNYDVNLNIGPNFVALDNVPTSQEPTEEENFTLGIQNVYTIKKTVVQLREGFVNNDTLDLDQQGESDSSDSSSSY